MRKILVLTACGVVGLVGVAQADKPPHPSHPVHPTHPTHPANPKSCTPRHVGYNAVGTLVSAALSPVAGHDRYSGTITVDVAKANHRASIGSQTFTLTAARVKFHHGIDATAPAAGSRVGLHGKITVLAKDCSTTGFSPTTTIRSVDVRVAK
jgi:hypothetical protein